MPLTDDDVKAAVQAHAAGSVADGEGVAPQAAQGALRDAPLSGIPASVGMHAPEVGAQSAADTASRAVLDTSRGVRGFVASDPAKAAGTREDWWSFGQIASDFGKMMDPAWASHELHVQQQAENPSAASLLRAYQDPADAFNLFGAFIGGVTSAATSPIARHLQQQVPLTAVEHPSGLTTFGFGWTRAPGSRPATAEEGSGEYEAVFQGLGQSLPLPRIFPRLFRQGPEINLGAAHEVPPEGPIGPEGQLAGPEGSVPPPQPLSPLPEAEFTIEPSPYTTEPTAPPGVRPEDSPYFHAEALDNQGAVEYLQGRISQFKTLGTSPELVNDFLHNHAGMGDTLAWVPPQALVPLYQQGHSPFADMAGEIVDALSTGRDVQVPLATYLTETAGQPFAEALNAATRFSAEGVSTDAAKELPKPGEEPVARTAPAPVEVPSDLKAHEEPIRALAAEADRAIEEVFKAHGIEGLFEDAAAAGLTKPQFERYGAHIDELRAALRQRLLERTYAQLRRERTPEWKAQLDAIVPFMEQALNAHPDVRAMRELMAKGMKLDRGDVEAFYPGAASRLPKGVLKAGGNHPDAAADLLGYPSGAELVNALADLQDTLGGKSLNAWVKAEAMDAAASQARVNLGYDPSPAGLLASAREMLVESPMETYLTEDLRALAAEAGLPFSKPDVKAFAARQFDALPTKDATNIRLFERGMRTTGETTQRALEKGKWDEAFRSRQQQLINLLQLQMAHAAGKTFRATQATLTSWARADTIPSTDPLVGAIVQAELGRVGWRLARDAGELGRFLALARAEGRPFDLPTLHASAEAHGEIIDAVEPPQGALRDLPWGTYINYTNSLKALRKFGQELQSITSQGKLWEAQAFADAVARNADALGRKFTEQQLADIHNGTSSHLVDAFHAAAMGLQDILAGQLRPEVFLHWVDGDKQGPLMGVVNELQAAKYLETDLSDGWVKSLRASVPGKFWNSMKVKVSPPEMMQVQTARSRIQVIKTRGNLRYALTYLGSETGRAKLLKGFGWGEPQEAWLKSQATAEDWQFVRAFWAENEKLFALADAKYAARRGYGLKKDDPRPVDTGLPEVGTLPGGHVHVAYDASLKDRMRIRIVLGQIDTALKMQYGTAKPGGDVMDQHPAASLPSAFYTEQRTGYTGPVNLNPRGLAAGVSEVIHDIAYRDALINAQKALTNPIVKDALESVLGPQYAKQISPWLRYIAQERMLYDSSTDALQRILSKYNSNISFGALAFQAMPVLKHGGVGLIHMAAEIKNPVVLKGAVQDLLTPGPKGEMWNRFVLDNSGEVRGLQFTTDASLSRFLAESAMSTDLEQAITKFGYGMFTFAKFQESRFTWLAKYRTAIHDNGNHELSVQIANKAVRDTQGAGHPVDQPAFLRRGNSPILEFLRPLYGMFMSFRSTTTNRLFTAGKQVGLGVRQLGGGEGAKAGENLGKAAVGSFAFVLASAVLLALEEIYLRGGGDPKAKTRGDAFKEELGWELLGQGPGSMIGPNILVDAAKFGNAEGDKLKAAAQHILKGEMDKVHGGIRLAGHVLGGFAPATPATALANLAQALEDEDSDLKPDDRGAVPFIQRAFLGRAPHYIPNKPAHRSTH